jgi:hypothetical protein
MGQFKPMVKMMTTEPTVELKLKKGGKVEKKMQMGGVPAMAPAMGGLPARGGDMAAAAPARPDMMKRRRMMKAMGAGPAAPVGTASRMMKKGGEAHEDAAEDRAMIKKAMAGKKFATGGVVMGQGGYKDGGIIKSPMFKTKVNTATPDNSPAKTGGVKNGNGGGYKTGGVAKYAKGGGVEGNVSTTPAGVSNTTTGEVRKGNAGGFKKGGATKKFARGGSVNDSGKAEDMPQGHKKPSAPVSITALSGTFKKGGKVKKMAEGGDAQQKANAEGYKNWEKDERKFNEGLRSDVTDALMYIPRKIKKAFNGLGSVTTTERETSKTVSPAGKKRGGAC